MVVNSKWRGRGPWGRGPWPVARGPWGWDRDREVRDAQTAQWQLGVRRLWLEPVRTGINTSYCRQQLGRVARLQFLGAD